MRDTLDVLLPLFGVAVLILRFTRRQESQTTIAFLRWSGIETKRLPP